MVNIKRAVIGGASGCCSALVMHISGVYVNVHDSIAALFHTHPLLAYALLTLLGALVGAFNLGH